MVLIPGILGSRLCDGNEVIWGDTGSYGDFAQLQLAEDPLETQLKPCGVIESIRVLGIFKVHQYDSLIEHLETLGYTRNRDLFVFDYDWRQSNFHSAKKLSDLVSATQVLEDGQFDIIGHSMGGIVARIYVQHLDGHQKVHSLVTLGTPHRGSLALLRSIANGFEGLGNFLAGGVDQVREVSFTFPSLFELLPSYTYCCIWGLPEEPRHPINLLDETHWFQGLVPFRLRREPWRSQLVTRFATARQLHELLSSPVPQTVDYYPFAGDHLETLSQVYFDPRTGWPETWTTGRGDGTVLLVSAADGNVQQARVSFAKHGVIFDDDGVRTGIERILSGSIGGPVDYRGYSRSPYLLSGEANEMVPVVSIALSISPTYVAPGEEVAVTLELKGVPTQPIGPVRIRGQLLESDQAIELDFERVADSGEPENPDAFYATKLSAPSAKGTYSVVVELDGLPSPIQDHFVVLDHYSE